MMARLTQLARDYTRAMDVKMASQAKRMMRENASATSQLMQLSDATTQLLRENERARRSESQLKLRVSMMEALEQQWSKKLRSNARVPCSTCRKVCSLYDKL